MLWAINIISEILGLRINTNLIDINKSIRIICDVFDDSDDLVKIKEKHRKKGSNVIENS